MSKSSCTSCYSGPTQINNTAPPCCPSPSGGSSATGIAYGVSTGALFSVGKTAVLNLSQTAPLPSTVFSVGQDGSVIVNQAGTYWVSAQYTSLKQAYVVPNASGTTYINLALIETGAPSIASSPLVIPSRFPSETADNTNVQFTGHWWVTVPAGYKFQLAATVQTSKIADPNTGTIGVFDIYTQLSFQTAQ